MRASKWIKKMARGYRNRERFRTAIYFHLGGLNLLPDSLPFPHELLKRQ